MLRRRESPTSQQETQMAEKSLRELQSEGSCGDLFHRLRLLCLSKGPNGILGLGRMFRQMDHDGHYHVHQQAFVRGLRTTGVDMTDEEAVELFQKFDVHGSGTINMTEFLGHVMPQMSSARKAIVEEAFKKADKRGDGHITIQDLKNVYQVNCQPRYISGEESEEAILKRFLAHFERDVSRHGEVTHEEFFNYYSAVSATIDDDCYFNLMMRQAYKL